jgi:hypothetical protein
MYSSIRTLLLVTAIAGVMALLSPVAHAVINITRAEVQWGEAVVMGRGADKNDIIYWEDQTFTASKRGKFNFRGAVPSNCIGTLSTADQGPFEVVLDNCTPDSGDPPGDPGDPPGDISDLVLAAEWEFAHGGDAVRAVGFIADEAEEGVRVRVISGGDDAYLRSWSWTPPDPLDSQEPEDLQLEVFGMLDHPIYDLESSADGFKVVTGEGDWNGGPGSDTLRIWDPNDFLIEPEGSQAFPLVLPFTHI